MIPIIFPTNAAGHPVTHSGKAVTCDGCKVVLTSQPPPEQQRPVPDWITTDVYGKPPGSLNYVVCERGADCFTLAALDDELYQSTRCRVAGCAGDRCDTPHETDGPER